MSIGLNDTFCFMASRTLKIWVRAIWRIFFTHLAVAGKVTAATQNQAKPALLVFTTRVEAHDINTPSVSVLHLPASGFQI